jgi:hypothetical protein
MVDVDMSAALPVGLIRLLSDELVEAVLTDVATAARAKWIRLAQQRLRSSMQDYVNGIQEVESRPGERVLTLVGWLANAVERGIEAFDLRETVLKNAEVSAAGNRYAHVPFRHSVPSAAGLAATPMGERYGPQGEQSRAFASGGFYDRGTARRLGEQIYALAKRMKFYGGQFGPGLFHRERSDRLPSGLAPRLAPWHKTDLYAGMVRTRPAAPGHRAQYMTWRTISEGVPEGWIHPGIEPRHLAEEVGQYAMGLVPRVIRSTLAGMEVG